MGGVVFAGDGDPVAALGVLLDEWDVTATATAGRLHKNERNRLGLLVVHGVAALAIGPLFAASAPAFTGPSWELLRHLPGFPYTLAALIFTGGVVLLPSTIARRRGVEMVGLALLAAWYTTLAVGFAAPAARWTYHALPAVITGSPLPAGGRPSLYAWAVYGHLAVIMAVHLATLAWLRRRRAR